MDIKFVINSYYICKFVYEFLCVVFCISSKQILLLHFYINVFDAVSAKKGSAAVS